MTYIPQNNNKISSANSTSDLLTSGSIFTGEWEDVTDYDSVVVATSTDQDGTYSIQFSPDGVNLDSTLTRYYRVGTINAPHRFTITRQFVRIVFTNTSASDQTYLRLQTIYGTKSDLNAPLDQVLAQDFDSTVVRTTNYTDEVALGLRQGKIPWNKWGYNADIDSASEETVWSFGGSFTPLTSASTLDIVSTSADDDDGGTGANSIVITGIDANRERQEEVITLNGVSSVTTVNSWLGVNRAAVYLAGTDGFNQGDINITATTGGSNQAQIPSEEGTTQQAIFFTQSGYTTLIESISINGYVSTGFFGATPRILVKCIVTAVASNAKYEVFREVLSTGSVFFPFELPLTIGENQIIEWIVDTDQNNTEVSVRFDLIEVRDKEA